VSARVNSREVADAVRSERLVRPCLELDWLDAELAGAVGLVAVSVLNDPLGLTPLNESSSASSLDSLTTPWKCTGGFLRLSRARDKCLAGTGALRATAS
jgi:hypothetical protein